MSFAGKEDSTATILEAKDGEAALEIIESHTPDVVVTDLQMPNKNGLELVLEAGSRFPHIPVVLMTAAGSEEIAMEALKKGAASYVPKSQLVNELAQIVCNLVNVAKNRGQQKQLQGMLSEAKYVLDQNRDMHTAFMQEFRGLLESHDLFAQNECFRITTALDEAISNAHYHGNLEISSELKEIDLCEFENLAEQRRSEAPYCDRKIEVYLNFEEGLILTVTDEGPGFNPDSLPDPFADGFAERPSGRGILLMRSFMDDVDFNSQGNQVTMIKKVEPLVSVTS